MKDWEKYEVQIFQKLRNSFRKASITKNARIRGTHTRKLRQVDILIESRASRAAKKIVVECKLFSKRVNVKAVEAFIGFLEDIGTKHGILVTDVGYTDGAVSRVTKKKSIKLDIVKFNNLAFYSFGPDFCPDCSLSSDFPSQVSWRTIFKIKHKRKNVYLQIGECDRCGTDQYKCIDCGAVLDFIGEESSCECGYFYHREYVNIGNGMTEPELTITYKE